ncbi:MAG: DUF2325 domain-containing protein [Coriobacteriales bacterium]|jgi:hypothetical protein|nr:DUF2325 domain-containing protein [Coriobacteriales bacterium]
MSIVIIGGHERMECQYKDLCKRYRCKAKVFTKCKRNLECLIGDPDMIILFTSPVSHEMAKTARKAAAATGTPLIQSHCASQDSLRSILEEVRG